MCLRLIYVSSSNHLQLYFRRWVSVLSTAARYMTARLQVARTTTCSNILVYSGVFTFLVECVSFRALGTFRIGLPLTKVQYPLYAASALASNSFVRASFAVAFPLFGLQMYQSKFVSVLRQR